VTEIQTPELSQLRWRCRRGMLELDLLLNNYLDNEYESLSVQQAELLEALLDYPDQVLFDLLMDKMRSSDDRIATLVERIRKSVCP
jgi:antitoxin CptB